MTFSNEIIEIIDIFFLLSSHLFLCTLCIPFCSHKPPFCFHVTCALSPIPFLSTSFSLLVTSSLPPHTHCHPPTVKDRMCVWKRTQIFVFLSLGCLSQYLCIIFLPSHTLSRLHLYCVCSPISPAWPWVPWRQRLFLLCTPRYFQQLCEVALWAMRLQGMYSTWQGESQGATFPV